MAHLDDSRSLADLSIPGTHETLALYEPIANTAKCQNLPLENQLVAGVRYIDVRCRHLDNGFQIYHGPIFEQLTFDDVLATLDDFLTAHPTETVIVSIKEESTAEGATRSFADTFQSYVDPERWYLGAAVPTLGDVRGKLVLLRRFAAPTTLGIDASTWADNTTFSITDPDASLRVQDAYKVTSTDDKWTAITKLFDEAKTGTGTLYLDYTSGYETHGGLPDPPSVANAINPQLDAYLAAHPADHLGVIANDFITETRASAIYRTNP